jgi:hypothetical protein
MVSDGHARDPFRFPLPCATHHSLLHRFPFVQRHGLSSRAFSPFLSGEEKLRCQLGSSSPV